jgi:hypothetical protein
MSYCIIFNVFESFVLIGMLRERRVGYVISIIIKYLMETKNNFEWISQVSEFLRKTSQALIKPHER